MSTPDDSQPTIFERTSDLNYTKQEQLLEIFDASIRAPFRIMWEDRRTKIGLLIIGIYVLMGTIGVVVIPKPQISAGPLTLGPFQSWRYPLGTDGLGRSLFRMIIHSTPAMLKMVLAGSTATVALATIVGTVAGFVRGWLDTILMTVADILLVIPGLPLVIVLSIIYAPKDPAMVGILLSINAWAGLARAIRSQVLATRNEEYVEASQAMGISMPTIISSDLLPNLMPYILTNFMLSARIIIFGSVALYFLGLLPFTTLNWGVMMNMARQGGALAEADLFYWLLIPMLAIIFLIFGLIMLAQGMDRVFNPRVRARHAESIANTEER